MTFPLLWFQLCMVWWWEGWSPTLSGQAQKSKLSGMTMGKYFLRFKKVGTLDWARLFPADVSSTSRAKAELTRWTLCWHGTLRRHLQETDEPNQAFLLFWNGGSIFSRFDRG